MDSMTTKKELQDAREAINTRLIMFRLDEEQSERDVAYKEWVKDPTEAAFRKKYTMWWSCEVKHECTNDAAGVCIADICGGERPRHASVFLLNDSIALCHLCLRDLKLGVDKRELQDFENEVVHDV